MEQRVDLAQLAPQQLLELRNSTDQELTHFTQSLQALQTAQAKLRDCIKSIEKWEKSPSQEILVPLTSSLYLPGKVESKDSYLVDIGTGYYVQKNAEDSMKVYDKKIKKLDEDSKKLKDILVQKNELSNGINLILRKKLTEAEAAKLSS